MRMKHLLPMLATKNMTAESLTEMKLKQRDFVLNNLT
jgi:hypothetical protein